MEETVTHIVAAGPNKLNRFSNRFGEFDGFMHVIHKKATTETSAKHRRVDLHGL